MTDNDVVSIFKVYTEIISSMVIQLETQDGQFPIEILNEVRAVFTHFARCALCGSSNDKEYNDNIKKAEGHIKRAVLDCFKYMCLSYDDKYKAFEERYKNVDLIVIDNGEFYPNLIHKRKLAVDQFYYAKSTEVKHQSLDNTLDAFQDAYNLYVEVDDYIESHYDRLHMAKKRYLKQNAITVSGWLIGAVSLIIGIVSWLGCFNNT